eukprot:211246_1
MAKLGKYCLVNKMLATIYWDYLVPILCILTAILTIIFICIYIKGFIKKNLKTSKFSCIVSTIFFIICFALLITMAIAYKFYCHDRKINLIGIAICSALYNIQYSILLGILFHRRFSNGNVNIFSITYVLTFVTLIISAIFWAYFIPLVTPIVISISSIMIVTLTIFLVSLFVNKLYGKH